MLHPESARPSNHHVSVPLHSRLIALVSLIFCGPIAASQDAPSEFPKEDVRASLVRHLDMTYRMPVYRTLEEWQARKEALRKQILFAAGLWPMPERTPLSATIFDRMERNGYSIEKVHFESYPGFLVTGNLYRPLEKSGPFPGVLSPHGHWAYGRLQNSEMGSIPARGITLARQGFVVFSYDMVGYNDSRQVNHRYLAPREELWGFGSLGLHLWNSIRAVDFLESLPDVDKKRIACTGASGGGTQTFLLTAVDDRIMASAPVNMISAHMQGGDVCENAPNLRIDTNNMEIAALMAPRPMIMVSATGDWTKNTLQIEYPAIQSVYRLYGAEDRIHSVQENADHNYNKASREHVYRWFGRWVLNLSDTSALTERNVSVEFPSNMLVFYGRPMPEGVKTEQQIIDEFVRNAAAAIDVRKPQDLASLEKYRETFAPSLRCSLMAEYPEPRSVRSSAPVSSETILKARAIRQFLGRDGKGDRVQVTRWLPDAKTKVKQAVLLVHPDGAGAFEESGAPGRFVRDLVKAGCAVLSPELFNWGNARFERTEEKRFFTTYNRTDDANRVQDILTSLAYLRGEHAGIPVKVVGYGRAGLHCILARALAADDSAYSADADQFEAGEDAAYLRALNIPGIRKAGDFKTALILNTRAPLWVQNAGRTFPIDWARSIFQALGKGEILKTAPGRAAESEIDAWLHDRQH